MGLTERFSRLEMRPHHISSSFLELKVVRCRFVGSCQLNSRLIKSKFVSEFVGTDKPTNFVTPTLPHPPFPPKISESQQSFLIAWENIRHFATPPVVYPRNDVWETSAEIPYWWRVTTQIRVVLLIGRVAREIWPWTSQWRGNWLRPTSWATTSIIWVV